MARPLFRFDEAARLLLLSSVAILILHPIDWPIAWQIQEASEVRQIDQFGGQHGAALLRSLLNTDPIAQAVSPHAYRFVGLILLHSPEGVLEPAGCLRLNGAQDQPRLRLGGEGSGTVLAIHRSQLRDALEAEHTCRAVFATSLQQMRQSWHLLQ
jgi:hypothetical protein